MARQDCGPGCRAITVHLETLQQRSMYIMTRATRAEADMRACIDGSQRVADAAWVGVCLCYPDCNPIRDWTRATLCCSASSCRRRPQIQST